MRTSGTSKQAPALPKILPCPKLLPVDALLSLRSVLCYVIRHYGDRGISVLIQRQPKMDRVAVVCGDWAGNALDLTASGELNDAAKHFLSKQLAVFINTMRLIKLEQCQLFLALADDGLVLVDLQVSLNKMAGPGLLRDVFGKLYRTQEVLKIEPIDERVMEAIQAGTGTYTGDLIIKPSRYRIYEVKNNLYTPLYVGIRR